MDGTKTRGNLTNPALSMDRYNSFTRLLLLLPGGGYANILDAMSPSAYRRTSTRTRMWSEKGRALDNSDECTTVRFVDMWTESATSRNIHVHSMVVPVGSTLWMNFAALVHSPSSINVHPINPQLSSTQSSHLLVMSRIDGSELRVRASVGVISGVENRGDE